MPFAKERDMEDVDEIYGEYQTTFVSDTGQVRADLYRRGDWLYVYVTFPTGLDPDSVTDPYVGKLRDFARERGFDRRLRMLVY